MNTGKWSGKRKQRRAATRRRRRRDCAAAATAATPHPATIHTRAAAAPLRASTAAVSQSASGMARRSEKANELFFAFFPTVRFGTSVTHVFISLSRRAISLKSEQSMKSTF